MNNQDAQRMESEAKRSVAFRKYIASLNYDYSCSPRLYLEKGFMAGYEAANDTGGEVERLRAALEEIKRKLTGIGDAITEDILRIATIALTPKPTTYEPDRTV